jgi:hypothetical protein
MPPKDQAPSRSPFAGCTILLILAGVALFLIGASLYSLFQQDKIIATFTTDQAMTLPMVPIEGHESEFNELYARLQVFRNDLIAKPDQKTSLMLSVSDLNFILATAEPLKDYKHYFYIKEIRDGRIIADHTRPMNGMPGSGITRHLNATVALRPVFAEKQLVFHVDTLTVPNATVPQEFISQIPPYRLGLELDKDPIYGPVLNGMTAMEIEGDHLLLRRTPGELPNPLASKKEIDSGFHRIIRVLVIGFLCIAGLGIFFSLRIKAKRERENANANRNVS